MAGLGRFRCRRGSWLPAVLWGVAFAILVHGLPVDGDGHIHLGIGDVLNAYTLLGGLATAGLFLQYGAVFIALKTAGPIRDSAYRIALWLALAATVLVGGSECGPSWRMASNGPGLRWAWR
ncbi:cytochrome oxidase subunit II family protein [Mycobacterium kansasii]|uniref:Cytochrome oxidase subunit II family protein n=1 Tax=Mycobacterium kansasii TaxID=1768 RepID=A0A1V3XCE8_MYCKA|nr:cytochrome oxidase subunit II family protein [Mycobacterium kansasii]